MKAMIRLQNHGCRGHPYWWIVIQGSYTNVKGRFIEHVGYYLPRKGKTVQRAVVFNKPRIRYWLAVGAQPSRSVHRMLSYIDYMPKPMPTFGFKYTYEKPQKVYERPENPEKAQWGPMKSEYFRIKERDELNLLERELRAQNEISKQVKFNEENQDVELVDSDIEDEKERTQTFHMLRNQFLELEKDTQKVNTRKRELLFRKMNKLAGKGLVNTEQLKVKLDHEAGDTGLYGTTARERAEKQLKFAKLLDRKREQFSRALHMEDMLRPISHEDYVNYIVEHNVMPVNKARREADSVFNYAKNNGTFVTRQDAWQVVQKFPEDKITAAEAIKQENKKNVIFPTKNTITPFPSLEAFDPYNYYDTKVGPTEIDNPNKAYETMAFKARPEPNIKFSFRRKQNKGRKTPVRVSFSTVNNSSNRMSIAAQPNLAVAYTGLMRKISNNW